MSASKLAETRPSDAGAPAMDDIHEKALQVYNLLLAIDDMVDRMGPESGPVFACVAAAVPVSRQVADDLEKLM